MNPLLCRCPKSQATRLLPVPWNPQRMTFGNLRSSGRVLRRPNSRQCWPQHRIVWTFVPLVRSRLDGAGRRPTVQNGRQSKLHWRKVYRVALDSVVDIGMTSSCLTLEDFKSSARHQNSTKAWAISRKSCQSGETTQTGGCSDSIRRPTSFLFPPRKI